MYSKLINLYGTIDRHPSGGHIFTPHSGVDIQPIIFANPDRTEVEKRVAAMLGDKRITTTLNKIVAELCRKGGEI